MRDADYRPRVIDAHVEEFLEDLPALMLVGPRASGKTTTARHHARDVVQLDRPAEAAAFRADPDAALVGRARPLLLDEWQEVPGVLGAVKRAVDANPSPGQFLLTGSVRADLEAATWPGTGRVVRLDMYGMTVRELEGLVERRPFLDLLATGHKVDMRNAGPNLRDYIERAMTSGFPEPALRLKSQTRMRWLDGYVDQVLTRDAAAVEARRDPARLRTYFETYALNTAGVVAEETLFDAAGVNRRTAVAYEQLLSNLFVVDRLPAWTSNRLKRLTLRPKRYVVEPALVAAALRLDAAAVLRDGDLLGRLLDSFVVAQLRAEVPVCESRPRLYHVRDRDGRHEVDIVAELGGGKVIGIEIKAEAAPDRVSAKHLIWLRDELRERFLRGVVLHTGPGVYQLEDRIEAAPICAIWGGGAAEE
jgi:hypothetical protein